MLNSSNEPIHHHFVIQYLSIYALILIIVGTL
ncbi:unnamed protein product, partial [Rotaria magnacalcarata]